MAIVNEEYIKILQKPFERFISSANERTKIWPKHA
jgi:hypothetical protein